MADDMFAAFAGGGAGEGGEGLAGSRLVQYMGAGAKSAKAPSAPSPMEAALLSAPEFVPASAAQPPTSSFASLSVSAHSSAPHFNAHEEPRDYAFTATSVNTPQPTAANGQAGASSQQIAEAQHQLMLNVCQ